MNAWDLGNTMIAAATKEAGSQWKNIGNTVRTELQALAATLVTIVEGVATRQLSQKSAKKHFDLCRSQVSATIAMLTILLEVAAMKIVNAALKAIADTINNAIGFKLIS